MGKPIYLKVEKELDHSLEKVWNSVAVEFGNVADYNPSIKTSFIESEIQSGLGTIRHCDFQTKGFIKESITKWQENQYFELSFTSSSVPMAVLRSRFTFTEKNHKTLLEQEFWYRMKPPFSLLSGLMKGKMRKTLVDGLMGLEKHLN